MNSVGTLALPFFGLILLGYVCGKLVRKPEEGLAWMNFFIIYVALPALFFKLVARTPFAEFSNWPFALATTCSTFLTFWLAFGVAWLANRRVPEATIAAVGGSYANVGYMGPGLTLAALGPVATVPTALIFVTDSALFFTLVPLLMAASGEARQSLGSTLRLVVSRVALHPFNIATAAGVLAAWVELKLPLALDTLLEFLKNAAAPCALFVLGVTVALRPLGRVPRELPALVIIKLGIHPLIAFAIVTSFGVYDPIWVETAVLMASLPPALNAFVLARQYDTYVERASSVVLVGTLLSVVTVTLMLLAISEGWLPVRGLGG